MPTAASRTALAALVALALAPCALAQTGPRLLYEPLPKDDYVTGEVSYFYFGDSDTDDGFNVEQMQVEAEAKLRLNYENLPFDIDRAQPRAGVEFFQLKLNTLDPLVPENLTDVSAAVGLGVYQKDNVVAGLSVGVGYAAVGAFGDENGLYLKSDLLVGVTFDNGDVLGVVLNFDGNRTFLPDVPLPGVQYGKRTFDERLLLSVGFPVNSVTWKPDDRWTFNLTFNIPDRLSGRVDYKFTDKFGVYGAYTNRTEAFAWDALDDGDDRVFFRQNRVEAGVLGTVNGALSFVLAGGYAFGQELETGVDTRDTEDLTELDPTWFGRAAIEFQF